MQLRRHVTAIACVLAYFQSNTSLAARTFSVTGSSPASLHGKVGPRRAGIACLPNGSVVATDFVRVAEEFVSPLIEELIRRGYDVQRFPSTNATDQVTLELSSIRASVCAPSWGLGDTGTLKGRATFVFRWTFHSPGQELRSLDQTIEIDTKKIGRKIALPEFAPQLITPLANRFEEITRER